MDTDNLPKPLSPEEVAEFRRLTEESRSAFDEIIERAFLNPAAARERMDRILLQSGEDTLYQQLTSPRALNGFGRPPGSFLSVSGYLPGAGKRRKAAETARLALGHAFRQHRKYAGLMQLANAGGLTMAHIGQEGIIRLPIWQPRKSDD